MKTHCSRSLFHFIIALMLCAYRAGANAQVDCMGVDGGPALPGTPCDPGQPFTSAGLWNAACQCIGYCDFWDMGWGFPGEACDDYNTQTFNDVMGADCVCHGICLGIGQALTPCDDGAPLTVDDMIDQWGCNCSGWSDSIVGRVFLDVDLDGVFGGSDLPIQNRLVQAGWGPIYGVSNASGMFYFRVTPATYQLTAAAGSFDTLAAPVAVTDLSGPGITSGGHELAMNAVALQTDLSVYLSSRNPRPGFYNEFWLHCRNEGNQLTDGVLSFDMDALQTYSTSEPAGALTGSTLTWQIPVLSLGEVFSVHGWLYTPPSVPLGTTVEYSANVQTTPPDAVPGNDTTGILPRVVGAYDPNDIQVTPDLLTAQDIANATPVTYTVRFQNTGTFLAENVRIIDILPPQLRPWSFDFLASSHPCNAQLSNGLLEFRFDGIMLPDSNANEPESHGWVMFRMTPQNFLLPGAQVYNSASIYFDFNEPIYTNSAVFEIELNTAVTPSAVEASALSLWPNPATDLLNISLDRTISKSTVAIIDMNGRVVRSLANAAVQDRTLTIPVADLADGLYTLRIGDGLRSRHQRFVKSR